MQKNKMPVNESSSHARVENYIKDNLNQSIFTVKILITTNMAFILKSKGYRQSYNFIRSKVNIQTTHPMV